MTPLQHYALTIRRRWWLVALTTILCTGAAQAYVATAEKVYEAHADVLVTPVPEDDTALLGLGLIRRSSDPTRDVSTASRLIANTDVASRVKDELRSDESPQDLLDRITVAPVAQSSVVSITATGPTALSAARLADAFGIEAVEERTERLHRELDQLIARLRIQADAIRPRRIGRAGAEERALYDRLVTLQALRRSPDPTLRLETGAAVPRHPVRPRERLSLGIGVIAGLLLGIAGAFLLSVLDSRERREERIGELGLPVLARVPVLRGPRHRHAFDEAFRILRAMLRFSTDARDLASLAVTSSSQTEGKTTTSYELAMAAAEAGQVVLLVEADVYRRGLRGIIKPLDSSGNRQEKGLLDYLAGRTALDEIISPTEFPGLSFVPAGGLESSSIAALLEHGRGESLLRNLSSRADLVILDCPPVGPRADALLIASQADGVLFVVDARKTDEARMRESIERLRRAGANLLGVVLNRDITPASRYDYRPTRG